MKNGKHNLEHDDLIARINELTSAAMARYMAIKEEEAKLLRAFPALRALKYGKKSAEGAEKEKRTPPTVLFDAKPSKADVKARAESLLREGKTQAEVSTLVGRGRSWVSKVAMAIGAGRRGKRSRKVRGVKAAKVAKPASKGSRLAEALAFIKERGGKIQASELAEAKGLSNAHAHMNLKPLVRDGVVKKSVTTLDNGKKSVTYVLVE